MHHSTYLLLFDLVIYATGFKISSTCLKQCKSNVSVKCDRPCNFDTSAISSLQLIYGRYIVDICTEICQCDKHEYVYPSDKVCGIIHSFAAIKSKENCECKQGPRRRAWNSNSARRKIQKSEYFSRRDAINYLIYEKVGPRKQNLRLRSDDTTINPWENWCKHKCADGLGGSACYCDILP